MRQADSTIKGYLYQFNKSIDAILDSNDDVPVVLEGVIEDIDVHIRRPLWQRRPARADREALRCGKG